MSCISGISQTFVIFWLPYWFPTDEFCCAELLLQNVIYNSPRCVEYVLRAAIINPVSKLLRKA